MWNLPVIRDEQPRARSATPRRRQANLLHLQRAAGNRKLGRMLMRQAATAAPKVVSVEPDPRNPNTVFVTADDGSVWMVTESHRPVGTPTWQPPRPTLDPLSPNPGLRADDSQAGVSVSLGGNQAWAGILKPGVTRDPPPSTSLPVVAPDAALQTLAGLKEDFDPRPPFPPRPGPLEPPQATTEWAKAIEHELKRRETEFDNAAVLPVRPFLDVDVKAGGLSLHGAGAFSYGGDFADPRFEATASAGRFDFGVQAGRTDAGNYRGFVIRVRFGGGDQQSTEGPSEQVMTRPQWESEYHVRLVRAAPRPAAVPPLPWNAPGRRLRTRARTETQQRYLYFRSATTEIDAQRSASEVALLEEAIARDGFKVTGIEAFTSPEGSLERRGRFRGNRALATERAHAAGKLVRERWPGALQADGFVSEVGELYGADGRELTGRRLKAHVVEQFRIQAVEARHREVLDELDQTRGLHRQAELIYPWLRRAVITLTRTVNRFESFDVAVPHERVPTPAKPPLAVVVQGMRYFLRRRRLP